MNPSDIMKFAQKSKELDNVMEAKGSKVKKTSNSKESYNEIFGGTSQPVSNQYSQPTTNMVEEKELYSPTAYLQPQPNFTNTNNNVLTENPNWSENVNKKLSHLPQAIRDSFLQEGADGKRLETSSAEGSILGNPQQFQSQPQQQQVTREIVTEGYPIPQRPTSSNIDANLLKELIKEVLVENGVINTTIKKEDPIVVSMNDKEIKILIADNIFGGQIKFLGKKKSK